MTVPAAPSVDADAGAGAATAPGGRWGFAHLPALDGLRGVAVVGVLAFHGGRLDGGYLGVDLFFALSGFLITSLLLHEHAATGRIGLGAFWGRRFRRLLPAVLLLVAAVALWAHLFARPIDLDAIRADGLATLLYVANWHTILEGTSYWDTALSPSLFQHTWSLAIEEQFYVFWPLIVVGLAWWTTRRRRSLDRWVGVTALVGACAGAAWFVGLHLLGASDDRVYQGTDTRVAALLGGAALAALARLRPATTLGRTGGRVLGAVGALAAVVLGALWLTLEGTSAWLYRGGLPLASALALTLVATIAWRAPGPVTPVLSVAPLRWLGLISYGLYLWHWPIYVIVDQRNGRLPLLGDRVLDDLPLLGLKLALSLGAALVSYVLVEQPIRRGALSPKLAVPAAVATVALVGVLLVASTSGGARIAGQKGAVGQAKVRLPNAPTVLVVGDSVAQSVVAQTIDHPRAFGVNPINRTFPGCSPVAQTHPTADFFGRPTDPPPCFVDLDAELPDMRPDVIVLLVGARPNDAVEVDGEWVKACDPGFDDAYREANVTLIERLRTSGAPVVVVTIMETSDEALPVEGADERIACANDQLAAAVDQVPGTALIDLNDFVCPDGECIEELAGDEVRPDGIHLSPGDGGGQVVSWLLAEVLEVAGLEPAPGTPAPPEAPSG